MERSSNMHRKIYIIGGHLIRLVRCNGNDYLVGIHYCPLPMALNVRTKMRKSSAKLACLT